MALSRGAQGTVYDSRRVTSPDAPPGLSRDLEGVLSGADAVVIFAGHKEYRGLLPARVKELSGSGHPAVVDGRNVVDPDARSPRRRQSSGTAGRRSRPACRSPRR
ncbi:MAG: UDP-glucose/GDP-mannose dehydrogenase family protein [Methanoculleus sp.]|nr:UDP-glucose/GDP-mannose dehydrogenase family protein [Methanoculleus sp.]